jgi:hypothetical protein
MARRMLYEACVGLEQGAPPPALAHRSQRVRAAGVLLPHAQQPQDWAKTHLVSGADQPVYSL